MANFRQIKTRKICLRILLISAVVVGVCSAICLLLVYSNPPGDWGEMVYGVCYIMGIVGLYGVFVPAVILIVQWVSREIKQAIAALK